MKFDSHVHSAASPDSQMNPVEAVNILRRKNLGVIFTEHMDYITPTEKAGPSADDLPILPPGYTGDFIADKSIYPYKYENLRANDVLLGLEIALSKAYANFNLQIAEEYEYDFIIGSVHFVDGRDIYSDFFNRPQFDDHYRRYLTYTREVIEASGYFDSLGHIDYPSRVSPFDEKNILYGHYAEEYDALLKLLAERDLSLEINTNRLGDATAEKNLFRIYKRFNELGGGYVTIGSDAHGTARLGKNFERAEQMAGEAGLEAVYYKKRRRMKK